MILSIDHKELITNNVNITEFILIELIKNGILTEDFEVKLGYETLIPQDSAKFFTKDLLDKAYNNQKEKFDPLFQEVFYAYPAKAGNRACRNNVFDIKSKNCKILYKKYKEALSRYKHDDILKGLVSYVSVTDPRFIVGMEVFFNKELYVMYLSVNQPKKKGIII